MSIESPLSVGLFAGKWCSYAAAPDLPHDQREEDGGSLVFDTAPLSAPLDILGNPRLDLEVCADRPVAMVAVRLSDVGPDDKATRVTYGLLNLTHREDSGAPQPLEPGRYYRVSVKLNDCGQRLPAGHRLRISLSTCYWPLAWPAPEPVRLTLRVAACSLRVPLRQAAPASDQRIAFGGAEAAPPLAVETRLPGRHSWRVIRDLGTDTGTLEVVNDDGTVYIPECDLEMQRSAEEWYSYRGYDYASLRGETVWRRAFRRGDWSVRTFTRTVLSSDAASFHLRAELDAYEGESRVYSRNWNLSIPRDLV